MQRYEDFSYITLSLSKIMLKDSIFRFFYTLLSMDLNEGYPSVNQKRGIRLGASLFFVGSI